MSKTLGKFNERLPMGVWFENDKYQFTALCPGRVNIPVDQEGYAAAYLKAVKARHDYLVGYKPQHASIPELKLLLAALPIVNGEFGIEFTFQVVGEQARFTLVVDKQLGYRSFDYGHFTVEACVEAVRGLRTKLVEAEQAKYRPVQLQQQPVHTPKPKIESSSMEISRVEIFSKQEGELTHLYHYVTGRKEVDFGTHCAVVEDVVACIRVTKEGDERTSVDARYYMPSRFLGIRNAIELRNIPNYPMPYFIGLKLATALGAMGFNQGHNQALPMPDCFPLYRGISIDLLLLPFKQPQGLFYNNNSPELSYAIQCLLRMGGSVERVGDDWERHEPVFMPAIAEDIADYYPVFDEGHWDIEPVNQDEMQELVNLITGRRGQGTAFGV